MTDEFAIILAIAAIPYCYVVVRTISMAYFHVKLQFHRSIMTDMED